MVEKGFRRYDVPEHDGNGGIRLVKPDGSKEAIDMLSAKVQLELWLAAIGGAVCYFATRRD